MADRYWTGAVGSGTGTWDAATTTNWSATDGGAGGASAPGVGDAVILNGNSGAGTITIGAGAVGLTLVTTGYTGTLAFGTNKVSLAGNAATIFTGATTYTVTGTPLIEFTYAGSTGTRTLAPVSPSEANTISFNIIAGTDTVVLANRCRNLNFTGFAGTFGNNGRSIYGNLTLSAGMTLTAGTSVTTLAATSGTQVVTSNGKTMDFPVTFNGSGGSLRLADAMTLGSTRIFTFAGGPILLDLNGFTLSTGSFVSSNSTARTVAGGSGSTIAVTGSGATAFSAAAAANLTFTGVVTISMTSASAKTFAGNTGVSWPTLDQGGAGALTISGSNSFYALTNTGFGNVTLTAGTTTTVQHFQLAGTASSQLTFNSSSAGTFATITTASGTQFARYVTVTDSTATGASWIAPTAEGNIDGTGNTGWTFTAQAAEGLSDGDGLYRNSAGLWGGNAGLWSGQTGLRA